MYQDEGISLKEAQKEINNLRSKINVATNLLGDDVDNIRINYDDPNEIFFRDQYRLVYNKLKDILYFLEYLSKPVLVEDKLAQNIDGRYAFSNGVYLTSGSTCEILYDNDGEKNWILTTIEYQDGYYATALGIDFNLDGKIARMRG